MAPDRLDSHIRSKIYHFESDVPDGLWVQIEEQIRPKRKRRPFLWLFLGLIGIAAFGLKLAIPQLQDNLTDKTLVALEHQGLQAEDAALTSPSMNQRDHPPSDQSGVVIAGIAPDEKPEPVRSQNLRSDHREPKAVSPKSSSVGEGSAAILNRKVRPSQRKTKVDIRGKSSLNQFNHQHVDRNQPSVKPGSPVLSRNLQKQVADLSRIGQRLFSVQTNTLDPLTNNCPSLRANKFLRPFAELTLGAGIPVRDLATRNIEGEDYLSMRNRTEKVRGVYAVRGVVGADIGPHWEAKVGLSFTQINEIFDFIDENTSRTKVTYFYDTIRNSAGEILEVRTDSSVVTEYGQRIKLSNNYYRFLDIPALVGYRFKIKGHEFIIQAGAALNLAFWKEADLLAPDESIVNVDNSNPAAYPVFKSRADLDLLGGIGYSLEVSERNTLRILASIRYPTSSLTLDAYPLEQNYTQIKLGLSWKHYLW